MIRGFLGGLLTGGVVSTAALAAISQLSGAQAPIAPAATAPAATAPAAPATTAPATADAPAGAVVPAPVAPAAPEVNPADPAPADPAPADPATPPAAEDSGALTPLPEPQPQVQTNQAVAEAAPDAVPAAEVATVADLAPAAQPATPATVAPAQLTAPSADLTAEPSVAVASAQDAPDLPDAPEALATLLPDAAPAEVAVPVAPPEVSRGETPGVLGAPPSDLIEPPLAPAVVEAPEAPLEAGPLPEAGTADAAPPVIDPPPRQGPRTLVLDSNIDGDEGLAPEPRLAGAADGVVTDRLPRIDADPATVVEAVPAIPALSGPPIQRFARSFVNPENKPLLGIVLIDGGEADLDREALANLPMALTFALDPTSPDAATHAAIYRKAGQEVVMLASGIPEGANASDLEVSFAALAERLPEAVAVMDTLVPTFQDNRPLATQIVPILAEQGRGLITMDKGLNAANQVASRAGLAAATAFRSLDGDGETADQVRRHLDRAAFRAVQDGAVMVIGSTREDTVAAILDWAIGGRSETVIMAPATAIMVAG